MIKLRNTKVIFCDLDNCLFDDRYRTNLLPQKESKKQEDYDLYHKANIGNERANSKLASFLEDARCCGIKIKFLSSRPEYMRIVTEGQLELLFGRNDLDVMLRAEGDCRSSTQMKMDKIMAFCCDSHSEFLPENIMVIDDLQSVIDAALKDGYRAVKSTFFADIGQMTECVKLDLKAPLTEKDFLVETVDVPTKSVDFLKKAMDLQIERGKQYDQPEGERSMGRCVQAFNAITGHKLREADGWLLMQILKDVRQWQKPDDCHQDSIEDCVSYAALKAEAIASQKK